MFFYESITKTWKYLHTARNYADLKALKTFGRTMHHSCAFLLAQHHMWLSLHYLWQHLKTSKTQKAFSAENIVNKNPWYKNLIAVFYFHTQLNVERKCISLLLFVPLESQDSVTCNKENRKNNCNHPPSSQLHGLSTKYPHAWFTPLT